MFLIDTQTGDMVRVEEIDSLLNPFCTTVPARDQMGQEEQDWSEIPKEQLVFPSGERLPQCWTDPEYRQHKPRQAEVVQR